MIDEENFNKLKQLDRIEVLLRTKRIEEKAKYNTSATITYIIVACLFLPIFLLLWRTAGLELTRLIPIINLFIIFLRLMVVLYLLELVYRIYLIIRYKKEKEELFNKFFKIEVKKC